MATMLWIFVILGCIADIQCSALPNPMCPDGTAPLNDDSGVQIFCGRGSSGECPPQSYCEISPTDTYAFCCPGDDLTPCARILCPVGTTCVVSGKDATCEPVEPESCETKKCPEGTVCQLVEIKCVTEPCYPVAECIPVCSLPMEIGTCKAAIPRWYFDSKSQTCTSFTYGGCGGNANNFESQVDCNNACVCNLPKEVGPCEALISRYHFNASTQKCEQFNYGGCDGNANNFESDLDCYNVCPSDPCKVTDCKDGTVCELQQVQCVRAPCPPKAACVPIEKEGECPDPEKIETCPPDSEDECKNDGDCRGKKKCCPDGRVNSCQRPKRNKKDWDCPTILSKRPCQASEESECNGDNECGGRKKCCSDGCVNKCTKPSKD